mgnify:FL=1
MPMQTFFADTQMEYEDELSASYEEKVYDKKEKHRFYVKVKDTRVSFGSVKMKPNRCEFISKEYGVKAGKIFIFLFHMGWKPSVLITCVKRYIQRKR